LQREGEGEGGGETEVLLAAVAFIGGQGRRGGSRRPAPSGGQGRARQLWLCLPGEEDKGLLTKNPLAFGDFPGDLKQERNGDFEGIVTQILRGFLHKILLDQNYNIGNIVSTLFVAKFLKLNADACMHMNN
jgi:hypothetical protein